MTTPTIQYNADLAQFVSDYFSMLTATGRRQTSNTAIAEAYIESCLVTEGLTQKQLDAEVVKLEPQIAYYR